MGFWLELGVAGFRVDAVPVPARADGIAGAPKGDPHRVPQGAARLPAAPPGRRHPARRGQPATRRSSGVLRRRGRRRAPPRLPVLDHAAHLPRDGPPGRARRSRRPSRSCRPCRSTPVGDVPAQPRRADPRPAERRRAGQEVFDAFGPDADMQVYGRGLRRRLPTMLGGDEDRIRMAYSLLFSLPGTPVLFYGEEIGMGENLDVPGRQRCARRCSGPTSPAPGSRPRPEDVPAPARCRASFGPARRERRRPARRPRLAAELVRAADPPAPGDPRARPRHVARRRRTTPRSVFAHRCDWGGSTVIAVHNLGARTVSSSAADRRASTTPSPSTTCSAAVESSSTDRVLG